MIRYWNTLTIWVAPLLVAGALAVGIVLFLSRWRRKRRDRLFRGGSVRDSGEPLNRSGDPQRDPGEEARRIKIAAKLEGQWMALYGDGLPDDEASRHWPVSYINAQLAASGEPWRVEFRKNKLHIVDASDMFGKP